MTVSVPEVDGVIEAEQLAADPVPVRVHDPLGVNVTVPVGVVGPVAVSVTVAVHEVAWPTTTVVGVHETVVVVVCAAAGEMLTVALPVLTPSMVASPR